MTHCRTLAHVAALHGVDEKELRALDRATRERKPPQREGGDRYYKAVRLLPDGRMVSLYQRDGKGLEYRVGVTVEDLPRREHNGGIYVYDSVSKAVEIAESWLGSWMVRDRDFVVMRCRCEGAYCAYGEGPDRKLAFHRVTPLGIE
jgi:hypothetical protein